MHSSVFVNVFLLITLSSIRGERTAQLLEQHLTSVEKKIDALLASVEQEDAGDVVLRGTETHGSTSQQTATSDTASKEALSVKAQQEPPGKQTPASK
ncbi:MAG: hypothetical protein M1814_006432 [Vezdaea aestivalis]|nr:MAG: hypothetical protein M1814_006432 [Vezdaea aestivalis]